MAERISGIADQVVEAVARRRTLRGAAVVDLACGTGNAALAAAERGALVTGVDLTPELIAQGERKAASAGRPVTWVVGDAADTGLPDASFDAAVSNMGIIFVEPGRQVAELARLLKPAATLGFSSWVRSTENPLFDPVVAVLGVPPDTGFSPDQWGDPATVTQRLSAHFYDIEIDSGSLTWSFATLEAALRFLQHESPMHVEVFRRADDGQRQRLTAAFHDALLAHSDAGGTRFDAPYVVVTATRRS